MDFYAIDVETAESDPASICQIGIAGYENGYVAFEWESLVKPDGRFGFDPFNIGIHGIAEEMVKDAPGFREIYSALNKTLDGSVVVCHTHFDRTAITRALDFYGLAPIVCTWLDSARVARRTWSQFAQKGYGLKNVCNFLGYSFKHHNALEDAKAAGFIVVKALSSSQMDIAQFIAQTRGPSESQVLFHSGEYAEEAVPSNYPEGMRIFSFVIETYDDDGIKGNIDELRKHPGKLLLNMSRNDKGEFEIIHEPTGLHIGYLPVSLQKGLADMLSGACSGWFYKIGLYSNSGTSINISDMVEAVINGTAPPKNYSIPVKLCIASDEHRFIKRMVKEKIISKRTAEFLIAAGYSSEEDLQSASDKDLLALQGVNKPTLARIRQFKFQEQFVFLNS